MIKMHVLKQLSRRPVIPNGICVSRVLCCGFNTSIRPMETNRIALKGKSSFEVFSRVPEVGLQASHVPFVLPFNHQPRRYAGHSKWANIKHTKTANDLARSKDTIKFVNFINIAVRDQGSADPKKNSKLAQVIAQIKEAKLSMATFDRVIQNLQNQKDFQHCIYPIKGPGNCTMLIEVESTNLNKSKQELNTILKKNRAIVANDSVLYMFDHKGLLVCSELDGKAASEELLDDATAHAIEAGANDVAFHDEYADFGQVLEFVTEPSAFFKVKGALENLKYNIVHADVGYIPKQYLDLSDEEIEAANKLFSKLSEHQDVQKVHVNIG